METHTETDHMQDRSVIDGFPMKNPARQYGGWLHVQLPTKTQPVEMVCNASDLPLLAPHRWRVAGDRVVTTTMEDGREVAMGIENILLNRPRSERVPHKNGDMLDCRRVNLAAPRKLASAQPNDYSVKAADCFLKLPCGNVAVLDREDLERVKPHRWILVNKDRADGPAMTVLSHQYTDGKKVTITLQRLLMNVQKRRRALFTFVDGDRLNFRKANLVIRYAGTPAENAA